MNNFFKTAGGFLSAVLVVVFVTALIGFLGKYLWDYVMPSVFGLPEITFWQMWALMFLAKILFSNELNVTNKNN